MGFRLTVIRTQICVAFALSCLVAVFPAGAGEQKPETPSPSFELKLNVERVLVPVVVRDRRGNTINDLKQEDFQVFDNGKFGAISGFAIERRRAVAQTKSASSDATATGSGIPTATIFLFDDLHLDFEDLERARIAGMNVIASALTGNNLAAVVSISGIVNTGLTRDPAKLQRALEKLAPHPLYTANTSDCPYIGYYEADEIANKRDPFAIEDAVLKYNHCHGKVEKEVNGGKGADPSKVRSGEIPPEDKMQIDGLVTRALMMGRQDALSTLATLAGIIHGMARLPVQSSLVFISPGFLTIESEPLDTESRIMDLAARSNISVSSLDARGLFTTQLTASQDSPLPVGNSLQVNSELQRATMRDSEEVMASLADGTGGIFFHHSNDLQAGLKQLAERPETLYLLQLSVGDVKHNGALHSLKVKVKRDDVQITARRAYFMPRPDNKAK